jgi:hypothetical protein
MTDTDDSWRARARDRMRPMKARALAELLMKTPDAFVLVDAAVPDSAVFPAGAAHEHIAVATRVITLSPTELLICSDEG